MNGTIAQSVGVDISKDTLDVHAHPGGASRRFGNNAKGFKALVAWLGGFEVLRVVFEPTGAYHHDFERHLAQAAFALVKVNLARPVASPKRSDVRPRPTRWTRPCSPASAP